MRRDPLPRELGHLLGRRGDCAANDVNGAEARQTLTLGADEYRYMLMLPYTTLAQQIVDCCDNIAGQGHHALPAALAVKHDLRPCSVQREVRGVDTDDTGCAWAELDLQVTAGGRVTTVCEARVAIPAQEGDNPWKRRGDDWKPRAVA